MSSFQTNSVCSSGYVSGRICCCFFILFGWLHLLQLIGALAGALSGDSPMLSPATIPDVIVAISGVFVLGLIRAKALKSTPSSAIAKITRGIGKMEPSRLNETVETCKTKHIRHKSHANSSAQKPLLARIMRFPNKFPWHRKVTNFGLYSITLLF